MTVRTLCVILWLVALLLLPGCSAPQAESRNVRFRMADLDQAVATVRSDLMRSSFLQSRQQSSGEVRLRAQPLTNLSLDRFTEGEEQMVVSRILADPRVLAAFEQSGIAVLDPEVSRPMDATHEFSAEIRSLARQGASTGVAHDARRDAYLLEYRIVERGSGLLVWQSSTEVARSARGLVID